VVTWSNWPVFDGYDFWDVKMGADSGPEGAIVSKITGIRLSKIERADISFTGWYGFE
jgi:hypothetical protein